MKPYWSHGDRIKPVELTRGLHVRLYIRSRTVSRGLLRSCTIANTIIHGHGTLVSFLKVIKIIHGFHGYTRMDQV